MSQLRTLVLSAGFCLAFCSSMVSATQPNAGIVPANWYTLPEEQGLNSQNNSSTDGIDKSVPNKNLNDSLDLIFSSQRQALSATKISSDDKALTPPSDKPSDWVPWRFVSFVSDLAVSANGQLGVLAFKGTPSISVYWQKRESKGNKSTPSFENENASVDSSVPVFYMDSAAGGQDVDAQVTAIHKAVMATGRVSNPRALRGNLTSAVHRFKNMSSAVETSPTGPEWYPSRLRMDLEISASGKVQFGTVGGDVKVRLEWYRIQPSATAKAVVVPSANSADPATQSIHGLVQAMTEDLSAVSANSPAGPHFRAVSFYVGLGIGISGNIAVAKASASAFGYIYFSRREPSHAKALASASPVFSDASWYLVDKNVTPEDLQFAHANGIQIEQDQAKGVGDGLAQIKIDRQQFREGIKRSFEIGGYFADRAKANAGSDWAIVDVKPGFAMSLSGDLRLAKITGTVTAQIDFKNQNF